MEPMQCNNSYFFEFIVWIKLKHFKIIELLSQILLLEEKNENVAIGRKVCDCEEGRRVRGCK